MSYQRRFFIASFLVALKAINFEMEKINWQYTLGEILIVIIGISIAFSINRCSDNSKNESSKQQYLINLKNDVESDKEHLKNNVIDIEEKIKLATEILPHLAVASSEKMGIVRKVFSISDVTGFNSNDITYQTLINSGDLKLIDDFALKAAIQRHYSGRSELRKAYERQENIHKEYLAGFLIEHADYDKMPKGEFPFSNEKLLKNIIQIMRGSFGIKIEATKKGIQSCDTLIAILNKSL